MVYDKEMLEEIGRLDENRLLNTSVEDLCDYFENRYKIEVPVILDKDIIVDCGETKIDVNGSSFKDEGGLLCFDL